MAFLTKAAYAASIVFVAAFAFSCSLEEADGSSIPSINFGTEIPLSSSTPNSSSSVVPSSSSVDVSSSSSTPSSSSDESSSSDSITSSSSDESSSSDSIPSSSSIESSSKAQYNIVYDTPVSYQDEIYQTVVIGTQIWMTRNLNYAVERSRCYGEDGLARIDNGLIALSQDEVEANCAKYGRLYDWSTSMALPRKCNNTLSTKDADCTITTPHHRGICPVEWHIPSNADWEKLIRYVDSENGGDGGGTPYKSNTAGKYLKATNGWNNGGNGTDKYGFSALPAGDGGGWAGSDGEPVSFNLAGEYGLWQQSSENTTYSNYVLYTSYKDELADWHSYYKHGFFSIRCVKD